MKRIVLLGASGQGKVVAEIAALNGYDEILFLDDDASVKECGGCKVIGPTSEAADFEGDKFVAIGNAKIRERFDSQLDTVTLVHPNAVISTSAVIGAGTVVMPGAVINADAKLGNGCIINTCSSVDHDCNIGAYVHVAVGAHVAGSCNIGDRTWIGAGATVSNNINICSDCMIGAGAVVVSDIEEPGTYVGVPAKRM